MSQMHKIPPEAILDNVLKLIGKDWMLVTAGTIEKWNTMTASWGTLGVLWNKPVAFCFVRPTRHTFGFIDSAERFSLSFFEERYRDALMLCGTKSGRDIDKSRATGLLPVPGDGTVYFEQARLVLECRKLYTTDIDPKRFTDPAIDENYPNKDYHRMFVGEVVNCLLRA